MRKAQADVLPIEDMIALAKGMNLEAPRLEKPLEAGFCIQGDVSIPRAGVPPRKPVAVDIRGLK